MSGNSFSQASFMSVNSTVFDSVGSFDFDDYWYFYLPQANEVQITLAPFLSDADVELYDEFENLIDSSFNFGTNEEYIELQLNEGFYYIRVYPYSGDTDYSLDVFATPINTDNAGNSLDSARVISVGSSVSFFDDAVGYADSNDYYRFTLNSSSLFELNLTGLSSDADVELLDSNGNYVDASTLSGSQSENLELSLNAGTYYINIYPYSGDTEYTLEVLAQSQSSTSPDNAGNSISNASPIGVNSSRSDAVGDFDENDYYRLDLSSSGEISLNLTGLSSDIDIELLDDNGDYITSSVNGGSNSETISTRLNAGTYYVHVYPWSGNSNYNLTVTGQSSPPPPNPNQPNQFSSTTGYGFADASAAVARAINQTSFPEVDTFGGANDWNVNMVNAPEVWNQGYTGQGIVVAVLDTGVDRNHPDLFSNIWTNPGEVAGDGIDNDNNGYIDDVYGWNFAENKNNTLDVDGHGTHVSGTIAGLNNGTGVTGIAYNAQIMPVKVLGDNGSGSFEGVARGIYYAVGNGANVINMSLGGSSGNQALQEAINYASNQGVIVVMAAGNESQSQPAFPARYATDDGIAIGAVSNTNNIANFSNRAGSDSSLIYVTNPGVSIYSSLPENRYASFNGTSMATPHVAGIVALMLDANPNLSDAQVREILISTTTNSPTISSFIGAQSLRASVDAKSFNLFSDGTTVTQPNNGGNGGSGDPLDPLSLLDTTFNRFSNRQVAGTYLFATEGESESIRANFGNIFSEDGAAFKVATIPNDDLVRFNRFANLNVPGTYLFATEGESASIRANFGNVFAEEGIAFYAYDANANVGIDYYRLANTQVPGTYLFVNQQEKDSALAQFGGLFVDEGVAFEVASA